MEPCNGPSGAPSQEAGWPVTIRDDRTGYRYPAAMHRCAAWGMYLESNYAPRPGSTFLILGHRDTGAPPGVVRAVIHWRKLLRTAESAWSYGLGIVFTT